MIPITPALSIHAAHRRCCVGDHGKTFVYTATLCEAADHRGCGAPPLLAPNQHPQPGCFVNELVC